MPAYKKLGGVDFGRCGLREGGQGGDGGGWYCEDGLGRGWGVGGVG